VKRHIPVILGLILAVSTVAFAGDAPDANTKAMAAPTDGNVFYTDKAGKHALDPICGMQVVVDDKTAKADVDGKRYYFCAEGCGKKFSATPAEFISKLVLPAGIIGISGNKMMAKCAVSGDKVAVNDKAQHTVYKGHDYYFCCDKCPKAFAKDPEKYVAALAKSDAKAPQSDGHKGH
jgi:YHS domain-containing protein